MAAAEPKVALAVRGRTRGSLAVLVVLLSLWVRGLTRSLRVGDKLLGLLRLCFGPKLRSRESACLSALIACTSARTLLSIAAADSAGRVARALTEGAWRTFTRELLAFAALGVPAAGVNAGLKYFTRLQALLFQRRLARAVNAQYTRGANFFKASALPGCKIDNVDQRVTTDVERFAESAAALLTTIFKPVLDVVLMTVKLGRQLGVHAPACVIGFSLALSQVKMRLLPSVKRLAQEESALAGEYRTAHARLFASADEVALFRGGARERELLDGLLDGMFRASVSLSRRQLVLGILDHYLIKYLSPCVAWALQARRRALMGQRLSLGEVRGLGEARRALRRRARAWAARWERGQCAGGVRCTPLRPPPTRASPPLACAPPPPRLRLRLSLRQVVSEFVRMGSHLSDLGSAVGHLVQAATKVASLAGITTRVSEVLDAVALLEAAGNEPFRVPLGARTPTGGARHWPSAPAAAEGAPGGAGEEAGEARDGLALPWVPASRTHSSTLDLAWLAHWQLHGAGSLHLEAAGRRRRPQGAQQVVSSLEGGQMRRVQSFTRVASVRDASTLLEVGGAIQFNNVSIASPDGQLLVQRLSFDVPLGSSVLVTGPNGCGKSSIVRVLGDLWPMCAGTITKPPTEQMLFVPQRPYLVLGTLRDQLTYPHGRADAALTLAASARRAAAAHAGAEPSGSPSRGADAALLRDDDVGGQAVGGLDELSDPDDADSATARDEPCSAEELRRAEHELEDALQRLLAIVDPAHSILGQFELGERRDWAVTLSGGQKQRIAMARLFYHCPRYAVLDECTSAVSQEVESRIYLACRALGISLFTVSHKPGLARFHEYRLHLDGRGGWSWSDIAATSSGSGAQGPAAPPEQSAP